LKSGSEILHIKQLYSRVLKLQQANKSCVTENSYQNNLPQLVAEMSDETFSLDGQGKNKTKTRKHHALLQ